MGGDEGLYRRSGEPVVSKNTVLCGRYPNLFDKTTNMSLRLILLKGSMVALSAVEIQPIFIAMFFNF